MIVSDMICMIFFLKKKINNVKFTISLFSTFASEYLVSLLEGIGSSLAMPYSRQGLRPAIGGGD